MENAAHLGLVAQAVGTINPDVLGEDMALLVQVHVLLELLAASSAVPQSCS